MKASWRWAMVLWFAAGCGPPQIPLSDGQLAAQSPFDLGPDSIDVSDYPRELRDAYDVFRERCSQCHTLARPVNFPAKEWGDWAKYVDKMHHKTGGALLTPASERMILDFLVYDAKRRKTTPRFRKELDGLTALYARVKRERGEKP